MVPSSTVMFFMDSRISRICLPDMAAQEPFSMRPIVRFCRLWAFRSSNSVSMGVKMPAL